MTNETIKNFHKDAHALGNLNPDFEPKATDHISEMIEMIETLISNGFAYVSSGNVLFVEKYNNYGALSGRSLDEMISDHKLLNIKTETLFYGTIFRKTDGIVHGRGRPGWHIECSAMSKKYLGTQFDIHAGGLDLIFPHHENEIAQSCCANKSDIGQLLVAAMDTLLDGEKMSKSLGNFATINNLLLNLGARQLDMR